MRQISCLTHYIVNISTTRVSSLWSVLVWCVWFQEGFEVFFFSYSFFSLLRCVEWSGLFQSCYYSSLLGSIIFFSLRLFSLLRSFTLILVFSSSSPLPLRSIPDFVSVEQSTRGHGMNRRMEPLSSRPPPRPGPCNLKLNEYIIEDRLNIKLPWQASPGRRRRSCSRRGSWRTAPPRWLCCRRWRRRGRERPSSCAAAEWTRHRLQRIIRLELGCRTCTCSCLN